MGTKTATVSVTGRSRPGTWVLYASEQASGIVLDTAAWFAWLEDATTRSFSYPVFDPHGGYIVRFLTVRKEERQRGGVYWSVYCREGRRMRRMYLGKSVMVPQARLEAIAEIMRECLRPQEATNTLREFE